MDYFWFAVDQNGKYAVFMDSQSGLFPKSHLELYSWLDHDQQRLFYFLWPPFCSLYQQVMHAEKTKDWLELAQKEPITAAITAECIEDFRRWNGEDYYTSQNFLSMLGIDVYELEDWEIPYGEPYFFTKIIPACDPPLLDIREVSQFDPRILPIIEQVKLNMVFADCDKIFCHDLELLRDIWI